MQPRDNNRDQASKQDYGKVAVLLGGRSSERDISLQSGAAVLAALHRQGVDAHPVDVDKDVVARLTDGGFARAFVALHGRGGEDGVIQGALESLNLPYTGSRVLGSALSMDKVRCKWIWQYHGLPTPAFTRIDAERDLEDVPGKLGMPVMVKPVREGSSCGASRVNAAQDLQRAWLAAARFDSQVMCERWVTGTDYTVSILDGQALPIIRIETAREFYDYQAKYLDEDTRYICPCGLPQATEDELADLCLRAFEAICGSGWGRVDLMLDADGQPQLLDVNTVPGMTAHSLVPQAARQAGIDFDNLTLKILNTSRLESDRPCG